MPKPDYKPYYHRNLPHIQTPGATLFITYRLANSLPLSVIKKTQTEARRIEGTSSTTNNGAADSRDLNLKKIFLYDDALDSMTNGPNYLHNPDIADIVADAMHYLDTKDYDLICFTVMPNHVHLVCHPNEKPDSTFVPIGKIMHSIKSFTAQKCNNILRREGPFWEHESYDHVIRNETEYEGIIRYILFNPVKAGLCKEISGWRWTYCKFPFLDG